MFPYDTLITRNKMNLVVSQQVPFSASVLNKHNSNASVCANALLLCVCCIPPVIRRRAEAKGTRVAGVLPVGQARSWCGQKSPPALTLSPLSRSFTCLLLGQEEG